MASLLTPMAPLAALCPLVAALVTPSLLQVRVTECLLPQWWPVLEEARVMALPQPLSPVQDMAPVQLSVLLMALLQPPLLPANRSRCIQRRVIMTVRLMSSLRLWMSMAPPQLILSPCPLRVLPRLRMNMAPQQLIPSAWPPPLPPRPLRMSTECLQLIPLLYLSPPLGPQPVPPSPPQPQTAMAPHQSNPLPSRRCPVTAMAPPQSNPHPSRRLTTVMALPPPQLTAAMAPPPQAPPPPLLMNTSLPVRMSPPPSPTPPPMTPASVQISQTHSGLQTVLAPASLTATAHPASRTRSSKTTAA